MKATVQKPPQASLYKHPINPKLKSSNKIQHNQNICIKSLLGKCNKNGLTTFRCNLNQGYTPYRDGIGNLAASNFQFHS